MKLAKISRTNSLFLKIPDPFNLNFTESTILLWYSDGTNDLAISKSTGIFRFFVGQKFLSPADVFNLALGSLLLMNLTTSCTV